MIIGLGLAPSAISQIGLVTDATFRMENNISCSCYIFSNSNCIADKRKRFFKIIPFLVGISTGYIVAVCLGLVDFTPVVEATFLVCHNLLYHFLSYTPNFQQLLTIAPIALVTMAEHIGDHTSLSNIIGKRFIKKNQDLERTLLGDGIATFVAGLLGGPANTTYGEKYICCRNDKNCICLGHWTCSNFCNMFRIFRKIYSISFYYTKCSTWWSKFTSYMDLLQ